MKMRCRVRFADDLLSMFDPKAHTRRVESLGAQKCLFRPLARAPTRWAALCSLPCFFTVPSRTIIHIHVRLPPPIWWAPYLFFSVQFQTCISVWNQFELSLPEFNNSPHPQNLLGMEARESADVGALKGHHRLLATCCGIK
jgi:hypothetical protein